MPSSDHDRPAVPDPGTTSAVVPGPNDPSLDEPRSLVIWRAKWRIVACALVAGGAAGAVTTLPPTTYSAQSTIRVSLLSVKGVPREAVLAQNDLAAQYAMLAASAPVLARAEATLGRSVGPVEVTPVNGYNIVGVTARAGDAHLAAQRAEAVARALIFYVRGSETSAAATANKTIEPQLKQLDAQITAAQRAVGILQKRMGQTDPEQSGGLQTQLSSQMALLGSLLSNRTSYFTAATRDAAAAAPQLTLLDLPPRGRADPRYTLVYGLVAALIAGLGTAEIVVLSRRIRALRGRTSGKGGGTRPSVPVSRKDSAAPKLTFSKTRGHLRP